MPPVRRIMTEAGERFLERVRPAVAEVRTAIQALDELRGAPRGTLRLNLSRFAYQQLIEPRLAEFLQTYPELSVDLIFDDALADIVDSGCDAGIRLGEMLQQEMVAVAMTGPQRMAVVGAPAYFRRHGKPQSPRQLLEHECINYRQISSRTVYRWEFTEQVKGKSRDLSIAVRGRITANDLDAMIGAAVNGLGLAYVLESGVARDVRAGKLVRVLDAFSPSFAGLFLYYPARKHVPPKLRAFAEFFRVRGASPPR